MATKTVEIGLISFGYGLSEQEWVIPEQGFVLFQIHGKAQLWNGPHCLSELSEDPTLLPPGCCTGAVKPSLGFFI